MERKKGVLPEPSRFNRETAPNRVKGAILKRGSSSHHAWLAGETAPPRKKRGMSLSEQDQRAARPEQAQRGEMAPVRETRSPPLEQWNRSKTGEPHEESAHQREIATHPSGTSYLECTPSPDRLARSSCSATALPHGNAVGSSQIMIIALIGLGFRFNDGLISSLR